VRSRVGRGRSLLSPALRAGEYPERSPRRRRLDGCIALLAGDRRDVSPGCGKHSDVLVGGYLVTSGPVPEAVKIVAASLWLPRGHDPPHPGSGLPSRSVGCLTSVKDRGQRIRVRPEARRVTSDSGTIADTASAQRMRSRRRGASGLLRDEGGVPEREERVDELGDVRYAAPAAARVTIRGRWRSSPPPAPRRPAYVADEEGTRTCANHARSNPGIGPLG
jgi:hypothetical protein